VVGNDSSPVQSRETSTVGLREILGAAPGALYAILDACDEPCVPEKVRELGDRAVSLYRGAAEQDYVAIAPYLAIVDEDLLSWIVNQLWAKPWGVLVVAPVDLASLRKHFRRFLIVEDPDGKQMYFRFYDPRVLPMYLATCLPSEVKEFFGPVHSFLVSGEAAQWTQITRRAGADGYA